MPVDDRRKKHRVDEVHLERVLDRDGLGLPLGYDGTVVVGPGQRVEAVAVRLPHDPDQLVMADLFQVVDRVYADAP
jgi:hypothetical protein